VDRVVASPVGFLGDLDLTEEAAQDAFTIAAERWPEDGVPANPGGWLTITARIGAIDRKRATDRLPKSPCSRKWQKRRWTNLTTR
jgi:RNA polymerase sigma-70 factor (ECF subfamily)